MGETRKLKLKYISHILDVNAFDHRGSTNASIIVETETKCDKPEITIYSFFQRNKSGRTKMVEK